MSLLAAGVLVDRARIFKSSQTAGRSVAKWVKDSGVALGKVAIAYEVIDRAPDIELAPGAEDTLCTIHAEFLAAFEAGERTW